MTLSGRTTRVLVLLVSVAAASACSRDPQAAARKYVAQADEHLAAGRLPEAIIEYRNAIQRDPLAADARVKLGDAYMATHEFASATDAYLSAIDLTPDDTVLQLKTGKLLFLGGRFSESKALAEKVIALDARHADAHTLLANSLAGLKDFDAAVSQMEESIKLSTAYGETYSNLGALELGRGQKQAAEAAFKKAIELEPGSTTAHLALANFYWGDNKREPSEAELKTVIEIDPGNVLAHRAIANLYLATNRAPAAEEHFKKVAEITKDPVAIFALADYYTGQRKPEAARAVLEPLTATPQTASLAETKLATIDYSAGQREAAHSRLQKVLEHDKTNLAALLTRTNALLSEGKLDEALASATTAVEHHKDSAEALYALARVQIARRETDAAIATLNDVLRVNPSATDAKLALARLHLAAGRADTSVGLAEEALAVNPRNADAQLTVVRGLLARKELGRAESELASLKQRYPDAPTVHALLGVLAGLKNNEPAAKAHFERALQLDPKSLEAVRGLVALDLAARRPREARTRVESRLGEDPRNTGLLLLAAQTFAGTGDLTRAEDYLRQLLAIDAAQMEAYTGLAQIYVKQGRLDAALVEFDQLAKRQQRPIAALTFAGVILQGQGKTDQARDRFMRALELDPEAAVAANNLAWLYAESGDRLDAALDLAQRAKAKLPESHEVNDTLGFVHYQRNAPADAIPYFERSIAAAPENPAYHYHLGLARAKTGATADAKVAFDRAVALRPGYPEAVSARQALAAGSHQ